LGAVAVTDEVPVCMLSLRFMLCKTVCVDTVNMDSVRCEFDAHVTVWVRECVILLVASVWCDS
jgi:hypothetical protein